MNHSIKKAFILGAGLGTRLRPLTNRVPKPLVPFFHKPLAEYAWDTCVNLGISKIAINTHHIPEMWRDAEFGIGATDWQQGKYIAENGELSWTAEKSPTELTLFHEPLLLETGGGLRNIRQWLGSDNMLVHNGDIFSSMPLAALLEQHSKSGLPATLALRSHGVAQHIAIENDRVIDIRHKLGKAEGTHVFSGIYCVNAELLDYLPDQEIVSVIPAFLALAAEGKLGAVVIDDGEWFDVGERESYLTSQQTLHLAPEIHPTASIAKDATVSHSIIGAHVKIPSGCHISHSVLWQNSAIEKNTHLEKCICYSSNKISGTHVNEDL